MSTTTRKNGIIGQSESRTTRQAIAHERRAEAPDASGEVTRQRIEARAYEIFEARRGNGGTGNEVTDWLQAERELNGSSPDPSVGADIEVKGRARGERLLTGAR
ncbi:MAG: DUF2934 domain-containing protein [Phycisphaerales bacterium]|nr:DUF2934 domain-containing protein [Phycisphaerales bacterium]